MKIPLLTENERAYNKVFAKIEVLGYEIKEYSQAIKDKSVTRFIPMELHLSVLESRKRERDLYKYILKLIKNEKQNL
tara:strand:- start:16 stop:246 length:231 start_codon:yes stop_codon:yes gene_type:complete